MIPNSFRRTLRLYQAGSARLSTEFWHKLLLQSNNPLACRSGCSNCCHQPLTMTLLDGILVYQWLANNHLWARSLKKRFEETAERTTNLSLEIWMLGMIPCPLLDEETKACRAYKGRPFICRIAYSYDSDSCHPHRFMQAMAASPYAPRKETLYAHAELGAQLLKKHRLPYLVVPFAAAVLHGEAICTTKDDYSNRAKLVWMKELRGD